MSRGTAPRSRRSHLQKKTHKSEKPKAECASCEGMGMNSRLESSRGRSADAPATPAELVRWSSFMATCASLFRGVVTSFCLTFACIVSSRFDVCVVLLPTRFIAVSHVHRVPVSNVACNVEWFYSIWPQILLTFAAQLEENPLRSGALRNDEAPP